MNSLDQVRRALLVAVDDLRTWLINGDGQMPAGRAAHEPLDGIAALADTYPTARGHADALPDEVVAGLPRRRYINPGDTILLVLPDTERCCRQHLARRRTRIHVTEVDAELDLTIGPGQLRLAHADAGIHRDPDTDRLYILAPEGDQP